MAWGKNQTTTETEKPDNPVVTDDQTAGTAPAAPMDVVPVIDHTRRPPRKRGADKGKCRKPKPAPDGDVLSQVLERIRGAQVAMIGEHEPEETRAMLLLEEALVIGEGGDVTEWLRGKVFGGAAGGAR